MMHEPEKSDPFIVAVTAANEGGSPAAEPNEARKGAEENTVAHGMRRTPSRARMSHGLDRCTGKPHGTGSRSGSPPCCIISMLTGCAQPMTGCARRQRRAWMG